MHSCASAFIVFLILCLMCTYLGTLRCSGNFIREQLKLKVSKFKPINIAHFLAKYFVMIRFGKSIFIFCLKHLVLLCPWSNRRVTFLCLYKSTRTGKPWLTFKSFTLTVRFPSKSKVLIGRLGENTEYYNEGWVLCRILIPSIHVILTVGLQKVKHTMIVTRRGRIESYYCTIVAGRLAYHTLERSKSIVLLAVCSYVLLQHKIVSATIIV